ncbi:MAG: hypothetical protein WCH57_12730 [Verrucomicrobiota bacterium]
MEKFWLRQGGRVALHVNCARWLESAAPAFALGCFATGCALLVARREAWSLGPVGALAGLAAGFIAAFAWRRTRKMWFSRADGLVRLEAVLGLHNRLSSAAAGVGSWPPPQGGVAGHWRWRWQRLAIPAGCGLVFLAAALWMPITPEPPSPAARIEPPLALSQVETALEELKRDAVPAPEALTALEQKLEALRSQPPEAWYSQGSLEAADALREETGHAIATLERHLDTASQALTAQEFSQGSGAPIPPDKETQWNEAMRGLQSGGMPLNKADLAALRQCTGKNGLSPQHLQALQQKLSQNTAACKAAMQTVGEALAQAKTGLCEGGGQDQLPGPGGGKTAPLGLRAMAADIQPLQEQALASKDAEHTALGDVMKVTTGAHKLDPNAGATPTAGGAAAAAGAGGEAVWKTAASPKEEAVLRRYFE